MAGKTKFRLTTSGLQAAAMLILLSAKAESLQCYWCGPLAEQVHRSQRAPSCETVGDYVTACEPGYTHCAVVASSPPFVESRYCVKFYQDECYTLYCNSSKTFRMTCPCRGELCNGPNTQREIDAFAVLAKTVAKTRNTRIKKRNAITTNNFVTSKKKIAILIQNDEEEDINNNNFNNESAVENEITEHIQLSDFTNETIMQSDQPSIGKSNIDEHEETEMVKTTTKDDEETAKEVLETTTQKIIEVINTDPEIIATKASALAMELHTSVENTLISNNIKPSMELPTAEALQQNSDPLKTSDKPEDQTTNIYMTTMSISESKTSPEPTKTSRNIAVEISVGTWLVINSIIINTIV